MATITATQARYIGNSRGGAAHFEGGTGLGGIQVAASQTFAAGDPVRPDATSGQIETAITGSDQNAVASLYGQAMEAASATTGDPVYVRRFRPGDKFVMNLESNGAGVATALAQKGDAVNFNILATTGKIVADVLPGGSGAIDTKPFGIILDIYCTAYGYADGDVLGDTNGRVIVELGDSMHLGESV